MGKKVTGRDTWTETRFLVNNVAWRKNQTWGLKCLSLRYKKVQGWQNIRKGINQELWKPRFPSHFCYWIWLFITSTLWAFNSLSINSWLELDYSLESYLALTFRHWNNSSSRVCGIFQYFPGSHRISLGTR